MDKVSVGRIFGAIKKSLGIFSLIWLAVVFPLLIFSADKQLYFNLANNWPNETIDMKILGFFLSFFDIFPRYFLWPMVLFTIPFFLISLWLIFTRVSRPKADLLIGLLFVFAFAGALAWSYQTYSSSSSSPAKEISGEERIKITLRDGNNQPLRYVELYMASPDDPWRGLTEKTDLKGEAIFHLKSGDYFVTLSTKSKREYPKYQTMQMPIHLDGGKMREQVINMQ